jgi:hypothetical protein
MDAYNALLHIHPLMKLPFLHPFINSFHRKQALLYIHVKVLDYAYDIKMWYLYFLDWYILLNMISSSIHFPTNYIIPFFFEDE